MQKKWKIMQAPSDSNLQSGIQCSSGNETYLSSSTWNPRWALPNMKVNIGIKDRAPLWPDTWYIYIITVIDIITYVQILRVSQNQVLYQNYGTVSVKPDFTKDHWCFGPSWDTKQNATYVTQLNEEARLSLSNLKPCLWCGWARSSLKRGVSHVLIPWNPPSHKSFQWLLQFHSMHANHGTSQPGLLLITTTAIIMKKHHGRNTV